MRRVPIYEERPKTDLEVTQPLEHTSDCERCPLHEGVRNPCIRPEGEPGGVLVVGLSPTRIEDQLGRPFSSATGKFVRSLIAKHTKDPIAYDMPVRCSPGSTEVQEAYLDACRPYGVTTAEDASPERILCFGGDATYSVLGRRVSVTNARRGYGWTRINGRDVPVFFLVAPMMAAANRFYARDLEGDIEWALNAEVPAPNYDRFVYVVESDEDADAAWKDLKGKAKITYDCETYGRMHDRDFRLECVTLVGGDDEHGWTWSRKALHKRGHMTHMLRRILVSAKAVRTQNGKYDDRSVLVYLNAHIHNIELDTRLGRKLLEPENGARLDDLAELVGMGGHKEEAERALAVVEKELRRLANPPSPLTPKGKPRKIAPPAFAVPQRVLDLIREGVSERAYAFGFIDEEVLIRYNARDVFSTRDVGDVIMDRLLEADPALLRTWTTLTRDASKGVRYMEHWGFACDRVAMKQLAAYCQMKIVDCQQRLDKYPGFNPNSPQQVKELLFGKLGLKPPKLSKEGKVTTDASALEMLKGKHPVIDDILTYRKYTKMDGTYATGLLCHIQDDGRIHASFLLDGAESGRMSSSDPNMTNIPRAKGNPEGKMLRDCFVAELGYSLLEFDFSQMELRKAAEMSGDPVLLADFKAGIDIHRNNARACCYLVWGITQAQWDAMTPEEQDPYRSKIKTATFGKLYGKTTWAMAKEWGVPVQEVDKVDQQIWGRYNVLASWIEAQIRQARKTGEVWTIWKGERAQRRPVYRIADPDDGIRKHAENQVVNTPIQGSAAYHATASLWPMVEWIFEENMPIRVIDCIHDAIILEVRDDMIDTAARKLVEIMTSHYSGGVPILVDGAVGKAWGSMQKYKLPA